MGRLEWKRNPDHRDQRRLSCAGNEVSLITLVFRLAKPLIDHVFHHSHPPAYYLPPTSIANPELISKTRKRTICEWKGAASYFSFHPPSGSSSTSPVDNRIWTYENPTDRFRPIKDYLCFYASSSPTVSRKEGGEGWRCEVDGEVVKPQEG